MAKLPSAISAILHDFPTIDTVFITAGIQRSYSLFDPSEMESNPGAVEREITTNLTAPNLLMQLFAPHLVNRAKSGQVSNIFITTSSIGYVPLGFYPTYCATKSGLQALVKCFRQQLSLQGPELRRYINVVEVVPPYVDTALDRDHRAQVVAAQGGEKNSFPPMRLAEFIDLFFESLEQLSPNGSIKKEIAVGFGDTAAKAWRCSFEPMYEQMGLSV